MASNPNNCQNNCEPCTFVPGSSVATTAAVTTAPSWSQYNTPAYAPITIVLQRQDVTKQSDVLTIEVDPFSEGFYVTFELKILGTRTRTQYMANTLYKYIGMYFKALSNAEENYKSVTFNTPLFPQVTMDIEEAKNYLTENLIPQIQFLMAEWPRV